MTKWVFLAFIMIIVLAGCYHPKNVEMEKQLATKRMHEKVSRIAKELKTYCDTEIYRKAILVADSTLKNTRVMQKYLIKPLK